MSEKVVYNASSSDRSHGSVSLFYEGEDYGMVDDLHDVINAQNERIAALEAQVARLVGISSNTFGGQPI